MFIRCANPSASTPGRQRRLLRDCTRHLFLLLPLLPLTRWGLSSAFELCLIAHGCRVVRARCIAVASLPLHVGVSRCVPSRGGCAVMCEMGPPKVFCTRHCCSSRGMLRRRCFPQGSGLEHALSMRSAGWRTETEAAARKRRIEAGRSEESAGGRRQHAEAGVEASQQEAEARGQTRETTSKLVC